MRSIWTVLSFLVTAAFIDLESLKAHHDDGPSRGTELNLGGCIVTKVCVAKSIAVLVGILVLISATATLAIEDRNTSAVVISDTDGREFSTESAVYYDRPVNSAQDHTLKIMLVIWSLKNNANDTN